MIAAMSNARSSTIVPNHAAAEPPASRAANHAPAN